MQSDRDPGLEIRDGTPVSTRFDDLYFSREDGLAESTHVFLDGCGLPRAWQRGRPVFTIGETGFGTGLNFLATWDLWRRTRPGGAALHYLAIEGYPVPRGMLARVLAPFRALAPLGHELLARYPDAAPGLHRIWFAGDRVCLTLAVGMAEAMLPALEARVDAWFLDGFAPAKNPSMWSEVVFSQLARLSAPGARLASFTAAGEVRRGLAACGFDIEKRNGYGAKRDCIAGTFTGTATAAGEPWFAPPAPIAPGRVAIVGAGVAGAALAGAFARRGVETVWADRHGKLAAEASGNPLGLMMARPTLASEGARGDGGGRAVNAAAFRHARAVADELGIRLGGNGVVELALDADDLTRFEALASQGALDGLSTELVDAPEASRAAGVSLDRPALWHRSGGWIRPRDWVAALAAGRTLDITAPVGSVEERPDGWRFLTADDGRLAEADAVVVASAVGTGDLLPDARLPIQVIRGQLTRLAETADSRRLSACLAFGGYLSPPIGGAHVVGATYDRTGFEPGAWPVGVRAEDHRRNLDGMPQGVARLFAASERVLGGRAALRAITPDRQPMAGPVAFAKDLAAIYAGLRADANSRAGGPPPYRKNLFVLSGLGSRGLVTAPLMAELVVAQMLGEPWPISREMAAAVHPNRFVIRALKRRRL